jgi:hypothetical protein
MYYVLCLCVWDMCGEPELAGCGQRHIIVRGGQVYACMENVPCFTVFGIGCCTKATSKQRS